MQARVVTEHFANPLTTDPKYAQALKPKLRIVAGETKTDWVWPVGTVVEGQKAVELVRFGLAEPIDKECADACGMDATQLAAAILSQEMAQNGVHSQKDQELYRAGVILGFESDGKGGLKYIDGPNAAAYKAELAKVKSADPEKKGDA